VLAKPGSIKPHTKFKGEVYILSKEKAAVTRRSSTAYPSRSSNIPHTDVHRIAEAAGGGLRW
jgi:translation elongation factor EF-Tu-like GTPase